MNNKRIYRDLSNQWASDEARKKAELDRLEKPTISERAFNYGMAAICIAGIVLVWYYSSGK
jgi:ribosomal protein L15E